MNYFRIALTFLSALTLVCSSCKKASDNKSASTDEVKNKKAITPTNFDPEGKIESSKLSSRSTQDNGKLFTRLSSKKTGVKFVNPILKENPRAYLYASAMGCGGVAVGDINGDGKPDLFFTGGPIPNQLLIQTDNLVFVDATQKAGVGGGNSWGTGSSIIDIDKDGDLDIYVCNYDSANALYLNQGDGTFTESAKSYGLNFISAGHTPAFSDYDLDGDLDLYLMTNFFYDPRGKTTERIVGYDRNKKVIVFPKFKKFYGITGIKGAIVSHDTVGQSDRLLKNNGDGTFTPQTKEGELIGKGNSAIWWDPDFDGRPDLFVANDFKDPDFYLRNQPNGSFKNAIKSTVPHTAWFSMGTDSADLDGDGRPDLLVADMSGTNHYKQKIGMGAMSASAEFLSTAFPRQYMRNAVFLNSGTDRLREAAHMTGLANSDWTWTVRLSDFDNDGLVDVFFTNGMAVNLNVADNSEATKIFPGETEWAKHQRAKTGPLKEQNLAFQNLGNLNFNDVSKKWGLDHVGMSYAATASDLDRDGDLELIVANLEEEVSIFKNNSQDSHRILVKLKGTRSNPAGIGSTIRIRSGSTKQIRYLTLSRGYMASGEAIAHFGTGKNDKIDELSVHWPSGHKQVFNNLSSDQIYTITEPGKEPIKPQTKETNKLFSPMPTSLAGLKHKETLYDDYAVQPLLPQKNSQLGPGMAWGDIDGDGDDDFYLAGAKNDKGKLIRNNGSGKFTRLTGGDLAADFAAEDMGALFFDSDSDGDLDLYIVSGGVECTKNDPILQDRLYLNNGKGAFTKAPKGTLPEMLDSGSTVTCSDFDSDGDLDLFVGGRVVPGEYPTSPKSYLLQNVDGKFNDITDSMAPGLRSYGMVTSAIWSDANGDKRPDLLVTYHWAPIRVYINTGSGLESDPKTSGLSELWGWWNGISAGDVDSDGDIDYAVSNFGMNTKYHPKEKKPIRVFYGDFDGTGESTIVEAKYENNVLLPIRGRSCSSNAMPFLLDKFKTFDSFARASLQEIYTPTKLDNSKIYKATELQSGILINNGEGNFKFNPLPKIAQIAPGFGIDLSDFDGDGNLDIYMVQNFYGPEPETGHMAGGLSQLLKGDGKGSFTPISPERSGLVVFEDTKSLTRKDLNGDGWNDYIVGVNNGNLKIFTNDNATGNRILSINLKGIAGNTTGVGSIVTAKISDGSVRVAEVYSGSGYLSQNPPTISFATKASDKVTEVSVAWPNGKESVTEISEGSSMIEIKQPD